MDTPGKNMELILQKEQHPKDPRVIVTRNLDHFMAAAYMPQYRAAILKRSESKTASLRKKFSALLEKNKNRIGADFYFEYDHEKNLVMPDVKILRTVQKEIFSMGIAFNAMNGNPERPPKSFVLTNFNFRKIHNHDTSVLNCVWFGEGTEWKSGGKILQVDEGDWFYFKEGFEHRAAKAKAGRTLITVTPYLG